MFAAAGVEVPWGAMRDGGVSIEPISSTASPSNETPPNPSSPPRRPWRPGRRSLQVGVVLVALAALVVLAVTNLWFSRRPAVSAKEVNGIVNQKVNTAISQLQSQ